MHDLMRYDKGTGVVWEDGEKKVVTCSCGDTFEADILRPGEGGKRIAARVALRAWASHVVREEMEEFRQERERRARDDEAKKTRLEELRQERDALNKKIDDLLGVPR